MNTHAPSQAVCEVAKVKVQVKDRVETTNDSGCQILATEPAGITKTTAVNLLLWRR